MLVSELKQRCLTVPQKKRFNALARFYNQKNHLCTAATQNQVLYGGAEAPPPTFSTVLELLKDKSKKKELEKITTLKFPRADDILFSSMFNTEDQPIKHVLKNLDQLTKLKHLIVKDINYGNDYDFKWKFPASLESIDLSNSNLLGNLDSLKSQMKTHTNLKKVTVTDKAFYEKLIKNQDDTVKGKVVWIPEPEEEPEEETAEKNALEDYDKIRTILNNLETEEQFREKKQQIEAWFEKVEKLRVEDIMDQLADFQSLTEQWTMKKTTFEKKI